MELATAQAAKSKSASFSSSFSSAMKIAAVRRGNCSFETKVKVAAASGFAAIVVINNDNTAFPAGAASLKFKSSIPCLMAGDSFLAVYKEMVGIKENAPDCVPMPPDVLAQYLANNTNTNTNNSNNSTFNNDSHGNATTTVSGSGIDIGAGDSSSSSSCQRGPADSSTDSSTCAAAAADNLVNRDDDNSNSNDGTSSMSSSESTAGGNEEGGNATDTTVLDDGKNGDGEEETAAAVAEDDPLEALKQQLADQQKLVNRMLASLQQGGILPDDHDDEISLALAQMQVIDPTPTNPTQPVSLSLSWTPLYVTFHRLTLPSRSILLHFTTAAQRDRNQWKPHHPRQRHHQQQQHPHPYDQRQQWWYGHHLGLDVVRPNDLPSLAQRGLRD